MNNNDRGMNIKKLLDESVDKDKLKSVYDKLNKGDTVTIVYGTSMSRGNTGKFKVTKGKTVVGASKVERITLVNEANPKGVKYYLYNRNGNIYFAAGDAAATIHSISESTVIENKFGFGSGKKGPDNKYDRVPQSAKSTNTTPNKIEYDATESKIKSHSLSKLNTLSINDLRLLHAAALEYDHLIKDYLAKGSWGPTAAKRLAHDMTLYSISSNLKFLYNGDVSSRTMKIIRKQLKRNDNTDRGLVYIPTLKEIESAIARAPKGSKVNEESVDTFSTGQDTFAGYPVFTVSGQEYSNCIDGRKKHERWNKRLNMNNETSSAIRRYSHKNPGKPIVIRNEDTGEMIFLRRKNPN